MTAIAVIISALPVGAVVNVFAEKYETMVQQTPIMVVLSTLLSILTLSILLIVVEELIGKV